MGDHADAPLHTRHGLYRWQVTDATARLALSTTISDLGKVCRQLDDDSLWYLAEDGPDVWVEIHTDASVVGSHTHTLSQITDEGTMAAQNANAVAITGGTITGIGTPSSASDVAIKSYVDGVASGLDIKQSVRVATAAPLPTNSRTGDVLTAGGNGALAAVDGVTLIVADRLLVKDEVTGANNGLYVVTAVGDGSNPFVLTRAGDANSSAEVTAGLFVLATEGTANADDGFVLVTDDPITLNTTALVFTQFSGAGGGYTDEDAQDAIGDMVDDSSSITLTYNDGTPSLVAAAVFGSTSGTVAEGNHGHAGVKAGMTINIDGGGAVIPTGVYALAKVPFACTVTGWEIVADASGGIIFEVHRAPTSTPSTFAQISGSSDPTISGVDTNKDVAISGDWTDVTLDEGDWLKFLVTGTPTTVEFVALALDLTRTI